MNINNEFYDRKILYDKLIEFGFKKEKNNYIYKTILYDNFEIIISIKEDNININVIDKDSGEEYLPFYVKSSEGELVGTLKEKYEILLKNLLEMCTKYDIFKENNSIKLINYIKEKYDTSLELLFNKNPKGAVFRKNGKWFGLLMKIKASSIDLDGNFFVEVLNVMYNKGKIDNFIDYKKIFPAYHMNKNSWITIKLDSISFNELKDLVDNSYKLVVGTGLTEKELSLKVYEYLENIPYGKVVTYKDIAIYLGDKNLARIVGSILRKSTREDLPYYKVLSSSGNLVSGDYKELQKELLEKEGIVVNNYKVDIKKYKWKR